MQTDLREFLSRFAGAVVMTLVPVVFIAFASLPLSLGRYPGELPPETNPAYVHMT